MDLPDRFIPLFLGATRANAPFATEAGARKRLRERTLRPKPYGPPLRLHSGVDVSVTRHGAGWPVYTFTPRNTAATGSVVYVHGGGWVNEIAAQHWQLAAQIAAEAMTSVKVPIYPLVPYGSAREVVDGVSAAVLEATGAHGPTILAGDSAGGQIALSSLLQLRDIHGLTLPRAIAISPALDQSMTNPEIPVVQPSDPWLGTEGAKVFIDLWKDTLDVLDPVVSPLEGSLEGLGPITLFSGTRDILNPDSKLFAAKAAKAGVDLEFIELQGQIHVYPLLPTKTGRAARRKIVELVHAAIAAGPN